jgi:hypothetical protein
MRAPSIYGAPEAGYTFLTVFPPFSEMWLPLLMFSLFTLFSVIGVFLIVNHWRGRGAAVVAALLTVLFFAALFLGVVALLRHGGMLGTAA